MRLIGCSVDDLEAQRAFSEKHSLGYPLMSDPGGTIAKDYGVYKDEWKVATRATVVIGEDGAIQRTYPDAPADGKGHAEAVYQDLAAELA